tara:strand:+ start:283 stop:480 length:198 start_codon:yes stop_codon:yes gene_type:complete
MKALISISKDSDFTSLTLFDFFTIALVHPQRIIGIALAIWRIEFQFIIGIREKNTIFSEGTIGDA